MILIVYVDRNVANRRCFSNLIHVNCDDVSPAIANRRCDYTKIHDLFIDFQSENNASTTLMLIGFGMT